MSAIYRAWAIFRVTIKRLNTQRGLAFATALGLIVAVALTMSVPLYADGVYQNTLTQAISQTGNNPADHPSFAFMFRYVSEWSRPVRWERVWPLDSYMTGQVAADLGLPEQLLVRYFKTDNFQLFSDQAAYANNRKPLDWVYFSTASGIEDHITLLEGSFPAVAPTTPDSPVEVLINEALATKLGIQTGETYTAYAEYQTIQASKTSVFPIQVAGIWTANDPNESYWFYNPRDLSNSLIVPEETFTNRIVPAINDQVYLALWYLVADGSQVHATDVPGLLKQIASVKQKAFTFLPDTSLDISPEARLSAYQSTVNSLTLFLYAFSIPLLGMILTFIGLVVGMSVEQRQNEIAVFRSRGGTVTQLLGMAALEGLLLGLVGLICAAPLAEGIAQLFGKARSFLNFGSSSNLAINLNPQALRLGCVAVGVVLLLQLLPTLRAARHTVITYKQELARQLQPPGWQRAWLDVLLLIPVAYGTYLLSEPLSRNLPVVGEVIARDPIQNPLLLLIPSLGLFALTLFILRLLPLIMSIVAWIAARTKSIGVLLAARHLARTSRQYHAPLILLILTLSLSTFTATLAQTLDRQLHDQTYYDVGADMSLVEMGEYQGTNLNLDGSSTNTTQDSSQASGPQWLFLPVSEHLAVPGVQAATRVAQTPATFTLSDTSLTGDFMGIDRVDFSQVAFWRQDFAPVSLGALMNDLALTSEGILVPRDFLVQQELTPGDDLTIKFPQLDTAKDFTFKIVGVFDHFPTWNPDNGILIVGNLDYLFEQIGQQFPYDVWLRTAQDANYPKMLAGIEDIYLRVESWKISPLMLEGEQEQPQRQGLFGLLSVGFSALALLTVLGFLLYALFSFRRRFIELGMLRAIGLSTRQMISFLAAELVFLLGIGLAAGTGLGVWMSEWFIPTMQVSSESNAGLLPLLVIIDWSSIVPIYILFGLLFVVALVALVMLLLRMKIFQAIKLGEAV